MTKIGIFCSASENIDKMYFDAARQLGQWIGETKRTLIYGGANLGLMEETARSVKENGGRVIGVIPSKLEENGKVSSHLHEIIRTHNLSDRKDVILEQSDILVALPGGVGTFDEVFHTMAAASIGYHRKRVILYNVKGFYDKLIAVLDEIQEKGFAREPLTTYYGVANTFEELKSILQN